jgi:hypothetical protein
MIAAAQARGWETYPGPQLAFYTSPPALRLYMHPEISPDEYATRWEQRDRGAIGQYPRDDVRSTLWPWLKQRGFVWDDDDAVLEDFLRILGRRPADLRPGLRLRKRWRASDDTALREARTDVNAILKAAGDASLPRR